MLFLNSFDTVEGWDICCVSLPKFLRYCVLDSIINLGEKCELLIKTDLGNEPGLKIEDLKYRGGSIHRALRV